MARYVGCFAHGVQTLTDLPVLGTIHIIGDETVLVGVSNMVPSPIGDHDDARVRIMVSPTAHETGVTVSDPTIETGPVIARILFSKTEEITHLLGFLRPVQ